MIWFIGTVIVAYLLYYVFIIRKYDAKGNRIVKKNKKNSRKRKEVDVARYPSEVELFIYKYKVDIKKVNFRAMLKLIGLTCSIDIAIIVTVVNLIKINNIYIQLGIGILLIVPIILISFGILGKVFKKKGLTKHV